MAEGGFECEIWKDDAAVQLLLPDTKVTCSITRRTIPNRCACFQVYVMCTCDGYMAYLQHLATHCPRRCAFCSFMQSIVLFSIDIQGYIEVRTHWTADFNA